MKDWILVQKQSNLLLRMEENVKHLSLYFWLQGLSERHKPSNGAETHCVSFTVTVIGFCRSCKADNPMVEVDQIGTKAVVTINAWHKITSW